MCEIVTIKFSPCIDKSTAIKKLLPNKKLQCAAPKLEPGGCVIKMVKVTKKLKGRATTISTMRIYWKMFSSFAGSQNMHA